MNTMYTHTHTHAFTHPYMYTRIHSPLIILGGDPEDDGRFGGGVHMCRGQLSVAHHTGAARAAVHAGKGHGPGLGPRLRFEAQVH